MGFSDLQCSEFLLCFGQWLGEVVFAPEQFSHPHAAFLCRKVASTEHTFIGGRLIGIIKYTILALQNAPLVQKGRSLLTRIRVLHDEVPEWSLLGKW